MVLERAALRMEPRRPGPISSPAHVLNPTSEMLTSKIRISTLATDEPAKELVCESGGKWNLRRDNGIIGRAP